MLVRFFVRFFVGTGNYETEKLVFIHMCFLLVGHLIHGFVFIYRGALQGMGETIKPFLCVFPELVVSPLLAYLFIDKIGLYTACIEAPAGWLISAVLLGIIYVWFVRSKNIYNLEN